MFKPRNKTYCLIEGNIKQNSPDQILFVHYIHIYHLMIEIHLFTNFLINLRLVEAKFWETRNSSTTYLIRCVTKLSECPSHCTVSLRAGIEARTISLLCFQASVQHISLQIQNLAHFPIINQFNRIKLSFLMLTVHESV